SSCNTISKPLFCAADSCTLLQLTSMGSPVRPPYACLITLASASSTERTIALASLSVKCNTSADSSTVARTSHSASGLLCNSSFKSISDPEGCVLLILPPVFVARKPRTRTPVPGSKWGTPLCPGCPAGRQCHVPGQLTTEKFFARASPKKRL